MILHKFPANMGFQDRHSIPTVSSRSNLYGILRFEKRLIGVEVPLTMPGTYTRGDLYCPDEESPANTCWYKMDPDALSKLLAAIQARTQALAQLRAHAPADLRDRQH